MYHLPGFVLVLVSQTRENVPSLPYPLRSSLGYHGRWTYSPVLVLVLVPLSYSASLGQHGHVRTCPWFMFVLCVSHCTVCTVLVSLVQCFALSVRVMYLLARVHTYIGNSSAVGQHGHRTFLPVSVMYLRVRACIVPTCPCLCPCTVFCYG